MTDPKPRKTPPPSDAAWVRSLAGMFLVFDGPDGSGKSTQARGFAALCREQGLQPVEVREPGGTDTGERIRDVLLDRGLEGMSTRCEMLLYMASRAELVERVIAPSLRAGRLVLADRFVSSTFAYQGAGGGIPREEIEAVARVVVASASPHLVVVFDVDTDTALRRMGGGDRSPSKPGAVSLFADRMEAKGAAFHARVREGFLELVRRDPARHVRVDASRPPDEVWNSLLATLRDHPALR